jgi:leucyl aminopeptidase (aminopeptidase T)
MTPPAYATNALRCLGVREGERFQMLCDEELYPVGLEICAVAADLGAAATITVFPESSRPLTEPSAPVVASIPGTDAVLLWLGNTDPVEVNHRRGIYNAAEASGRCRLAFGAHIDAGVLEHEMAADYAGIAARSRAFAEAVRGSQRLRITGSGGTELEVALGKREWKLDDGVIRPGSWANLPAGEIFIAPLEDSAEGIVVVDGALAATGEAGLVDEPVRIEFQAGRVVSVQGGRHAAAFRELVGRPGGDVIAELGIGTNERARMQGNVMTDEKVLGSAHVAVGYNLGAYGGANDSTVHCDGCFRDASIEADGRLVIERGELVA